MAERAVQTLDYQKKLQMCDDKFAPILAGQLRFQQGTHPTSLHMEDQSGVHVKCHTIVKSAMVTLR